ncbi:MAG: AIPR family protein [Ignavibacteria bacterium]|nr:AIPR family protein [Ignavibacteria bacterium]
MDIITKNLLDDFLQKYEINPIGESEDFEKFCSYSIVSKEYNDEFSLDDVSTYKNQGVDSIAIIVNGHLVNAIEEIDDIIDLNKYLDITFIFIQAKTSSKFEGTEIGNFIFTVKDFFKETSELPMNEAVKKFTRLKNCLFQNFPKMTKGNPTCKLYYVTTGKWVGDKSLQAVIDGNIKELEDTQLFSKVFFEPCDASLIQKYYRKTSEKVSAEFNFDKFITLPKIDGVQESYFGIISFGELRSILIDENGKIKNVFYDNVRDYLGENEVNDKINKTIQSKKYDLFTVLNNGITIVADEKSNKGNDFFISNYQVVNGCQTSHVLFKNKDLDGINITNIPLRLIITSDENIKTQITLATNRQTSITEEQLAAFSEFQKNLELYYYASKGNTKLYYERRTGQYNTDPKVIKTRIVTIKNQIKVFASMFLNKPHLVSGYYGKVYKSVEENIFKEGHKYSPYYTSGLTAYVLEYCFRIKSVDTKYKKARYHILMLFRMIVNNEQLPGFNSNDLDKYCSKILEVLNDNDQSLEVFSKVINILDESGIDINNQKLLYQKSSTDTLIEKFNEKYMPKKNE